MKRKYIKSSGIISKGYDNENAVLEIEFITKEVHRYFIVPKKEYDNFMEAESNGEYFNKQIRPKDYEFEKRNLDNLIVCKNIW